MSEALFFFSWGLFFLLISYNIGIKTKFNRIERLNKEDE